MDTSSYRNEASIVIDREAGELYDLVSDVSRMGSWSPVCTGGAYDADGEWFTGTNVLGDETWETRCRVVVAERGREFAFINHGLKGKIEVVRWGFRFRPIDESSTEVTQTWDVLPGYVDGFAEEEDPGMTPPAAPRPHEDAGRARHARDARRPEAGRRVVPAGRALSGAVSSR